MRSFSCGALTRSTPRHSFIPAHEPIDLINVGFENPRSLAGQFAQARQPKRFAGPPVAPAEARAPIDPYAVPDRLTGREAVAELRVVCPERAWRFVEVDVPYAEAQAERARVRGLMYPNDTEMDLVSGSAGGRTESEC